MWGEQGVSYGRSQPFLDIPADESADLPVVPLLPHRFTVYPSHAGRSLLAGSVPAARHNILLARSRLFFFSGPCLPSRPPQHPPGTLALFFFGPFFPLPPAALTF